MPSLSPSVRPATDRCRWGRAKKVAKIELPDFEAARQADFRKEDMTPEQMRSMMKEKGIVPPRRWDERPFVINCSQSIVDPFDPDPEVNQVNKGRMQKLRELAARKYARPLSRICKYLPEFDEHAFATGEAVDVYVKAHETLARLSTSHSMQESDLLPFVTEKCLPEMVFRADRKTIHWKLLSHLEKPQFVRAARVDGGDVVRPSPSLCSLRLSPDSFLLSSWDQGIEFGQVTVRFHTQQLLAIYDRFGRSVRFPVASSLMLKLLPISLQSALWVRKRGQGCPGVRGVRELPEQLPGYLAHPWQGPAARLGSDSRAACYLPPPFVAVLAGYKC